jgi:hypothetical protein
LQLLALNAGHLLHRERRLALRGHHIARNPHRVARNARRVAHLVGERFDGRNQLVYLLLGTHRPLLPRIHLVPGAQLPRMRNHPEHDEQDRPDAPLRNERPGLVHGASPSVAPTSSRARGTAA